MALRIPAIFAGLLLTFALRAQSFTGDSLKTGVCYFRNATGIILTEGYYKHGHRHGIWTWYHQDGSIHYKCRYKSGRRLWTIYYDKGNVWMKINRYGRKRIIRKCDCQP